MPLSPSERPSPPPLPPRPKTLLSAKAWRALDPDPRSSRGASSPPRAGAPSSGEDNKVRHVTLSRGRRGSTRRNERERERQRATTPCASDARARSRRPSQGAPMRLWRALCRPASTGAIRTRARARAARPAGRARNSSLPPLSLSLSLSSLKPKKLCVCVPTHTAAAFSAPRAARPAPDCRPARTLRPDPPDFISRGRRKGRRAGSGGRQKGRFLCST